MKKSIITISVFAIILGMAILPPKKSASAFHTENELELFRTMVNSSTIDSSIIFPTASLCSGCHGFDPNGYAMVDFYGNDVNMFDDWRSTMMANSAKDPFWRAQVSHEIYENATHRDFIETQCTSCHAPMGHYEAIFKGAEHYTMEDLLVDTIGLDGISCGACHKISADLLGQTFSGNITFDTNRVVYGPYDEIFFGPMAQFVGYQPVYSEHINDAGTCAPCHTLVTSVFDVDDNPTGETFVEQATYHEWLNSDYETDNVSCQGCHMPRLEEPVVISSNYLFLEGRSPYGLHNTVGGNAHMLKLMKDNRVALDIDASAEQFDETISETLKLLQFQTLDLDLSTDEITNDTVFFSLSLENLAGHKFPSGYPSRRAVVELLAITEFGDTLFHSGIFDESFDLVQEDEPYELHHTVIRDPNQVQIYEFVAQNTAGEPTTVLEQMHQTIKDNRLTPKGFSTDGTLYDSTRIVGQAAVDPDFNLEDGVEGSGADRINYHIARNGFEGLLNIIARVHYQPLPPRWMAPMFEINTPEIDTFRTMFDNSDQEPVIVAQAEIADLEVFTVSSTQQATSGNIKIYPNPLQTDILYLELPDQVQLLAVSLYDQIGRLLPNTLRGTNQLYIEEAGIYYLEITTDKGVFVKKVVRK